MSSLVIVVSPEAGPGFSRETLKGWVDEAAILLPVAVLDCQVVMEDHPLLSRTFVVTLQKDSLDMGERQVLVEALQAHPEIEKAFVPPTRHLGI
jgi:hypothetical protein